MRLIDADSIRFKPYYDEYVDYDGYINDLKTWQLDDILSDRVDNTPTVEAIPIEWLKKWVENGGNESVDDFTDVDAYCDGYQKNVIECLLRAWEKENE